ncbi:hypothetical protein [Chryseobacterium gossypii]|uniref:hypothetical protein n=1 Tax=Chryseobacterium gossypii TaxID=3231602 RepID=UPI00352520A1
MTTDNLIEEQKLQIKAELATNKRRLKFKSFEIGDTSIFFRFAETFIYTRLKTVYSFGWPFQETQYTAAKQMS